MHDDVFITDIGGQALDILPHSPETAQMTIIVKSYIHSHVHSHSPSKKEEEQSQNSPNMMHFASSPLPVLLLSNVVGDIHEGCYQLLWAGLLWGPSHLRLLEKTVCRCVQQKLHHS